MTISSLRVNPLSAIGPFFFRVWPFFLLFYFDLLYIFITLTRILYGQEAVEGSVRLTQRGKINRVQKVVPPGYCLSPCARTQYTHRGP